MGGAVDDTDDEIDTSELILLNRLVSLELFR